MLSKKNRSMRPWCSTICWKPRQTNDRVWDAIRSPDDTVRRRIPHANLNHVVGLLPGPIGEA